MANIPGRVGYDPVQDPYAAYRYPSSPASQAAVTYQPPPDAPQRTLPVQTGPETYDTKNGPAGQSPATGADDFDSVISATLLKRYGKDFDLNDPERGLTYFKRRAAEEAANGDGRDTAYWNMRASGVNEAQYAADEAKKAAQSRGYLGNATSSSVNLGQLFAPLAQTMPDNNNLWELLRSKIPGLGQGLTLSNQPAMTPVDRQALAAEWPQ